MVPQARAQHISWGHVRHCLLTPVFRLPHTLQHFSSSSNLCHIVPSPSVTFHHTSSSRHSFSLAISALASSFSTFPQVLTMLSSLKLCQSDLKHTLKLLNKHYTISDDWFWQSLIEHMGYSPWYCSCSNSYFSWFLIKNLVYSGASIRHVSLMRIRISIQVSREIKYRKFNTILK